MSTQFENPGQQGRSATVSYAAYAQFAVGGLAVIATIISIMQTAATMTRLREEFDTVENLRAEDLDAVVALGSAFAYGIAAVSLLFALVVALLGVFNLKGKNGTRITTWVLAGLGLLCGVCGSIGGAANTMTGGSTGGGAGDAEFNQAMERALADLPAWYNPTTLILAILNVVLYLAIIILLAMPASNDFFRKPKSGVDVLLPPEAYMDQPPRSAPPAGPADPGPATDDPEQPKP